MCDSYIFLEKPDILVILLNHIYSFYHCGTFYEDFKNFY